MALANRSLIEGEWCIGANGVNDYMNRIEVILMKCLPCLNFHKNTNNNINIQQLQHQRAHYQCVVAQCDYQKLFTCIYYSLARLFN